MTYLFTKLIHFFLFRKKLHCFYLSYVLFLPPILVMMHLCIVQYTYCMPLLVREVFLRVIGVFNLITCVILCSRNIAYGGCVLVWYFACCAVNRTVEGRKLCRVFYTVSRPIHSPYI